MGQHRGYSEAGRFAAAGVFCLWPLVLVSQDTGGLEMGLTLSERLTREDGETSADTGFGLALTSETRRQSLALSVDGTYRASLSGEDSELIDPRFRFGYDIENAASALTFDFDYKRARVDDLIDSDPLDPSAALILDEGTREDYNASAALVFGRDAPFGGTFGLGYVSQSYSDTTSPSLVGSERVSANLDLRFEIDPRIIGRFETSVSDTDRDGAGLDVRREEMGAGVDLEITPTLVGSVDLGYIRLTQSGSVPESMEKGVAYSLGLREERPDGGLDASLMSDISEAGRRTTLEFGRRFELPRGTLGLGLGFSRGDGADAETRPLYSMSYVRSFPETSFDVGLAQGFSTDSFGVETLNSTLSFGYARQLTPEASLNADVSLRDSESLAPAGLDTRRLDMSLSYRQALTRDWDVEAGYTHSRTHQDGRPDDTSDEIFVGLRTAIRWRP